MKLRKPDIDLKRQTFRREVLKGQHKKGSGADSPEGTISNAALPYWQKLYEQAKDDEYIFSKGFRLGPKQIRPDNINKRWRKIVKKKSIKKKEQIKNLFDPIKQIENLPRLHCTIQLQKKV